MQCPRLFGSYINCFVIGVQELKDGYLLQNINFTMISRQSGR